MEEIDLNGMEGGKRNAAKHWNEYLLWKAALKANDTQQDGWSHEFVDRHVLMAKVTPWLAGHLLSYSAGANVLQLVLNVALAAAVYFLWSPGA